MNWTTIAANDIEAPKGYKFDAHNWIGFKKLPWQYCNKCGLLGLRNTITTWCIKKGCNYEDHNEFKDTVKRLTK